MTNWDDEEFLNDINTYSELTNHIDHDSVPEIPSTIQKYHKIIQHNNSPSIFEDDYSIDRTLDNSKALESDEIKTIPVSAFPDNDKVIRVFSGRGRGGRNVFKPSANPPKVGISDDDVIIHQLRKVAPTGYSNEITEKHVRQVQKTNSPINLNVKISSAPCTSSATLRSGNSRNSNSVTSSAKSSPKATNFSDSNSSLRSSPSIFDYEDDVTSQSSLNPEASPFISKSATLISKENANKPAPLSELLRQSRESHKRLYLERQQMAVSTYNDKYENELASKRAINEILRKDIEEERQKVDNFASSSSTEEVLPWRRRTNSPPMYAWDFRNINKNKESVNINSTSEFPPL